MVHGGVAAQELRSYIERIEKLEEEKSGISEDIRDVYAEAKANGYDPKTMRQVVKLRKMKKHEVEEQEALLDTYRAALGMIPAFEPVRKSGASLAPKAHVEEEADEREMEDA